MMTIARAVRREADRGGTRHSEGRVRPAPTPVAALLKLGLALILAALVGPATAGARSLDYGPARLLDTESFSEGFPFDYGDNGYLSPDGAAALVVHKQTLYLWRRGHSALTRLRRLSGGGTTLLGVTNDGRSYAYACVPRLNGGEGVCLVSGARTRDIRLSCPSGLQAVVDAVSADLSTVVYDCSPPNASRGSLLRYFAVAGPTALHTLRGVNLRFVGVSSNGATIVTEAHHKETNVYQDGRVAYSVPGLSSIFTSPNANWVVGNSTATQNVPCEGPACQPGDSGDAYVPEILNVSSGEHHKEAKLINAIGDYSTDRLTDDGRFAVVSRRALASTGCEGLAACSNLELLDLSTGAKTVLATAEGFGIHIDVDGSILTYWTRSRDEARVFLRQARS